MSSDSIPTIEIDARATEFIQEHGGSLYVFADGSGLEQVKSEAPVGDYKFTRLPAQGIRFFVDAGIDPPSQWQVVFHHLPHSHVAVNYDGGIGGWKSLRFPLLPPS